MYELLVVFIITSSNCHPPSAPIGLSIFRLPGYGQVLVIHTIHEHEIYYYRSFTTFMNKISNIKPMRTSVSFYQYNNKVYSSTEVYINVIAIGSNVITSTNQECPH